MPEGTASHTRKYYSRLGIVVNTNPPFSNHRCEIEEEQEEQGRCESKRGRRRRDSARWTRRGSCRGATWRQFLRGTEIECT